MNDCQEYVLSHLSDKIKCLYEFGKEAIDSGKKLFNIQLEFSTILFKKEILIYSGENFDFFVKFFLDSDNTINSNDKILFT